jgi:hypothetical protein
MGIFRIRRLALIGAAATAALMIPTNSMAAVVAAGVVEGNGTISPPLTTVTQPVSGGFTGTLVGATSSPTAGTATCTFTFASTGAGDNVATGQGTASGSCSGSAGTLSASLGYTRVGPVVALTGSGSVNGAAVALYVVGCVFVPTSAPAVASFALVCAAVGVGAP